jgi:hypothetical protein
MASLTVRGSPVAPQEMKVSARGATMYATFFTATAWAVRPAFRLSVQTERSL